MTDDRKPIYWMILFGIVRHVLSIIGAWMASRGLIDNDTRERMLSDGAAQIAGWLLMLAPVAWSVAQKMQIARWLRTALHLDSDATIASIPAQTNERTL